MTITLGIIIAILFFIGLRISYNVGHLEKEILDLKEKTDFVICKETKMSLRKGDAKMVTKDYSIFFSPSYDYYSPKFAPEYDYVDYRNDKIKYFKTVAENKIEVKVHKSK